MKHLFLLLILLVYSSAFSQVENANVQTLTEPSYYQDFLNFSSGKPGITRTDVFIQVPYNEIQFVLAGNTFEAQYTVSISVYDESKGKLITEKTWSEKLQAKSFDQTTSRNNFNLSMRSFELVPAKYVIRTSIEDRESSRNYVSENLFNVRDLSKDFSASDILILVKNPAMDTSKNILPNISKNVAVTKAGIPIFLEFYSKKKINVKVEYSILDDKNKVISQNFEETPVDSGTNRVFYTFRDTSLALGTYQMFLEIKGPNGEDLSKVTKAFSSRWSGIPAAIQDLDKAVAQMVYIATNDEMSYIKNAENRDEKIKRFLEYWKKKDPLPESETNEIFNEYYRRVEYANKNFSHYQEGWRTDRGMVFIILGAPNNVERHPFDYDAKPYEVWEYYNMNRSFVFVDETGFGDYRLITPLYGDNYRFR